MVEKRIQFKVSTLLPGVASREDSRIQLLKNQLQSRDGVHRVDLSGDHGSLEFDLHYNPTIYTEPEAEKLTYQTGSAISKRYHHATYPIEGMDCSDCALVLEHGLSRLEGILHVKVDYVDQRMQVEYDRQRISRSAIIQYVHRIGYSIPKSGFHHFLDENQAILLSLLAGLSLWIGWLSEQRSDLPDVFTLGVFLLSYLAGGYPLTVRTLRRIFRERNFDTDQLMLAAAIGAAVLGEWAEGALLLFLFSLGHALENRTLDRARKAILALAEITPRTARARRDGKEEAIPIDAIRIGDLVLIPPGSRVPVDGEVRAGTSAVDQSPITGESLPVDTTIDDEVFAGTINGEGALEVEVTRLARDSTLARVVQLVQQAQAQKSPSEQFSERIIKMLVPSVLVVDFLLILVPPLFGIPFKASFLRAMTLLVAASPCALALGTPSAILAGVARAAQNGVLIKGGAHLENLGHLDAIAFDKTGTITLGKPHLTDILARPPYSEDAVLGWAAAVERQSAHPLARAIVTSAEERGIDLPYADSVKDEAGKGIRARIGVDEIWVGRAEFCKEGGVPVEGDLQLEVNDLKAQGKTIIVVCRNDQLTGVIGISDQVRPETKDTIADLKRSDMKHILMLTGDHARSASPIAAEVGLDDFRAGLMPEDKLQVLRDLTAEHKTVAMVGDGVNDAPALANATVGIAMGGAKTEVALEAADVVLMADDLSKLPFAINLGRKTSQIILQNMIIALGVIAGLIASTLLNLTDIGLAILLHEGSTVLVVFNALRLLSYRETPR
jgi:Cd2+/Zn2+-exporting ATPase